MSYRIYPFNFGGVIVLFAYFSLEDALYNIDSDVRVLCDKYRILDTDDFVLQTISDKDLISLLEKGVVTIQNLYLEDNNLYVSSDMISLLDIGYDAVFSSLDKRISISGDNKDFSMNTLIINDIEIEPFFFTSSDYEDAYLFTINGTPIADFFPCNLDDNYFTIDDIIDNCFMGFDIVYKLTSNIICVKYVIKKCEDVSFNCSISLFFDKNGNFIDSFEHDNTFKRVSYRELSTLVTKLKVLKKGLV